MKTVVMAGARALAPLWEGGLSMRTCQAESGIATGGSGCRGVPEPPFRFSVGNIQRRRTRRCAMPSPGYLAEPDKQTKPLSARAMPHGASHLPTYDFHGDRYESPFRAWVRLLPASGE